MRVEESLNYFKLRRNKVQLMEEECAIYALEKQIPKKPYKIKEHKQNDYYCSVCRHYLGDEMELKYDCLQPKFCKCCGQSLDWSIIYNE